MRETIQDEACEEQQMIEPTGGGMSSVLLILVVAGLAFVGGMFLPSEQPLADASSAQNWLSFGGRILRDTLFAAGVLGVCIVVSRFVPQIGLLVERLVLRLRRRWFLFAMFVLAFGSSASMSWFCEGGLPHIQDETSMLFQAKVFASGRLYAQTPPLKDFFDHEYILFDGPRWYGKYFPGPSALLVPGVWLGVPWLINPLLAGITVLLAFWLGYELLGEKTARIAAVLMVISPFRTSLFGMMMAHPATMLALTLAAVAVARVVKDPSRWGWAAVAGIGLGFGFNSRPLTSAALGGVMGISAAFAMPWRRLHWQTVAAFCVPMVLFGAGYVGYNKALTGDAQMTPFEKWCPKDHLGFGPDIGQEYWPENDRGHSFSKAISHNTFFSLDCLGVHLTGMGYTSLLLLAAGPFFCKSRRLGWSLGLAAAALVVAYFFYFTPSTFAGQVRYWSESMPAMLLLVVVSMAAVRRFLPRVCRAVGIVPAVRTGRAACWLSGLVLIGFWVPTAYSDVVGGELSSLWVRAIRLRDRIEAERLDNAVVFISTRHYRSPDRHDTRWDNYGGGFCHNDPDLRGPVIFARDLGPQRDAELMKLYPGRQAYLLKPEDVDADLVPLSFAATQPVGN